MHIVSTGQVLIAPATAVGVCRRPSTCSGAFQQSRFRRRQRGLAQHAGRVVLAHASLDPASVFSFAITAVMPMYVLMVGFPRHKLTNRLLGGPLYFMAASSIYAVILAMWLPEGVWAACAGALRACAPLPDVAAVAGMFKTAEVTALAWLHLLFLDLLQAREVWRDGLANGVGTAHSIVLCFMVGPVGILSHLMTKGLIRARRARWKRVQSTCAATASGITDRNVPFDL